MREAITGVPRGAERYSGGCSAVSSSDFSEEGLKLFAAQVAVVEDFRHQPGSDGFTRVRRNYRDSTIGMPEEVVTSRYTDHLEACA